MDAKRRCGSHSRNGTRSTRSLRLEAAAGRTASRSSESRQERRKHFRRPPGALGRDQISAHRDVPAVRAGAGALPRSAQELRGHAAGQSGGVSRARGRLPGTQENHSSQDRAGTVRDPARHRERNPGAHPAVVFWRAESRRNPRSAATQQLRPVREPPGVFRGWPRRLSLRRALRHAGQLGSRSRPLSSSAGRGLGFPALALRRRNDYRDHRFLAVRSGKRPCPGRHGHAR